MNIKINKREKDNIYILREFCNLAVNCYGSPNTEAKFVEYDKGSEFLFIEELYGNREFPLVFMDLQNNLIYLNNNIVNSYFYAKN